MTSLSVYFHAINVVTHTQTKVIFGTCISFSQPVSNISIAQFAGMPVFAHLHFEKIINGVYVGFSKLILYIKKCINIIYGILF